MATSGDFNLAIDRRPGISCGGKGAKQGFERGHGAQRRPAATLAAEAAGPMVVARTRCPDPPGGRPHELQYPSRRMAAAGITTTADTGSSTSGPAEAAERTPPRNRP